MLSKSQRFWITLSIFHTTLPQENTVLMRKISHQDEMTYVYIHIYNYIILDALPSSIEYTGRRKAILDEALAESNMAFLSPVFSIFDGKTYNILYITHYIDAIKQYQCHSSSFPVFVNFGHFLVLSFAPPLDVRKRPIHWSCGVGASGLVSKLTNITYIWRFSKYSLLWRKYRLYIYIYIQNSVSWCCVVTRGSLMTSSGESSIQVTRTNTASLRVDTWGPFH